MPLQKGCAALGGNRIGKSHIGAFISSLIVTGEHPTYKSPKNGIIWMVASESKKIAEVIQPYFESLIPQRYKDGGKYNGKLMRWLLKADDREWEVWYKTVESGRKSFEGAKIDFAWIDEEPKDTGIFSELEMRLIDKQGIWLMTATPVEGTRWLKETIERDDVFYTMAGMRENPYIPLDEIEKISKKLSEDERMVRIEGKYIIFGGRPVFDRRKIEEMQKTACSYQEGLLVC